MFDTIKKFLRQPKRVRKPFTVEKVWNFELTAAGIILLGILFANFLIYQKFVSRFSTAPDNVEEIFLLRKTNIENASKKIDAQKAFIEFPSFQFVKNPF